jgi:hypothetical protein
MVLLKNHDVIQLIRDLELAEAIFFAVEAIYGEAGDDIKKECTLARQLVDKAIKKLGKELEVQGLPAEWPGAPTTKLLTAKA